MASQLERTASHEDSETDLAVSNLQKLIADRVREARKNKAITRRELSELSGVSQRYLAQLEAGDGNISIGLLLRVAQALDYRIEWLVSEETPWDRETTRAAELFRRADRTRKDAALRMLEADVTNITRANRICLIGLRGAGKSTLGKLAAERLNVPFLELNSEIEEASGMPVAEIMALYGQEGYRRLEFEALERVAARHEKVILAAAGGVVADPEAFNVLLAKFNAIWLRATPQEHMNRVRAQGDERPMAGNPEAMEQLKSILKSREALYNRAQAQLNTSGLEQDEALDQLIALIKDHAFLG